MRIVRFFVKSFKEWTGSNEMNVHRNNVKTLPNPSLKKLVVKENVGSNVTAHDCMKLANILRL